MNLRINVSFKNNTQDYKIYEYMQTQRDKSNFIKNLIEKEIKKEGHKKPS